MAAIVVGAKADDEMDTVDVVDVRDSEKAVKPVIATKMGNRVSALIAKVTTIRQMHAEKGNELRREETAVEQEEVTMRVFASSEGES